MAMEDPEQLDERSTRYTVRGKDVYVISVVCV